MYENLSREIIDSIGEQVGNNVVFCFDYKTLIYAEIKQSSYDKYLYLEMIGTEYGELFITGDCDIEYNSIANELYRMEHY